MSRGRAMLANRWAVLFFALAVAVAALALTSGRWLPALPKFLGFVDANSDTIGPLLSFAQLVAPFAGLAFSALLGWLGLRSLRGPDAETGPRQTVDAAQGGRGAAVGDVDQGVVIAGDNNPVSLHINEGDSDGVAPSSPDPGDLAGARRRLEDLPLGEVPDRAALPPHSRVPLRPNPHFVGRGPQLRRIAANLKEGGATAVREVSVAASTGLGGVGKTQLASEFVYRYGQYFHGVYWVSFAEPGGVPAEIASCGAAGGMNLRPSDFHALPLEERAQAVMAEWRGELPRLLVFDNCEDEDLLDRWLPQTGGCRVLVTSRRGSWDSVLGVSALPLDVLEREESVALLREHRPDLPPNDPDLDAVADELGDLPLALDLAGRHLKRYARDGLPAAYLAELRRPELLEHASLRKARGVSPTKHDMDVWRTFALSYRRLEPDDETDGAARRLLARAARLAPGEAIPGDLLARTLDPPGANEEPRLAPTSARDALYRLAEIGLLGEGDQRVEMHRLVAVFALAEIDDGGAQADVERTLANAAIGIARSGQPARFTTLLPHLRHAAAAAGARDDEPAYLVRFALGAALCQLDSYAEAVPYLKSAVEFNTARLGATAWLTMRQRNDLGVAMKRAGDLDGALSVYEPLLEDRRNELKPPHEDVASTLINIGSLMREKGLLHEVLPRYREALGIREEVLARMPTDDPERRQLLRDLAESHANLGALSMDLGRPRDASLRFERALVIHEELEETLHDSYAKTTMGLGAALGLLGDYPSARSRLERALCVHRQVLREGHPQIARNLILLGALLAEEANRGGGPPATQKREILGSARGHLAEALALVGRSHGEDHPLTGAVMRTAAHVAQEEGRQEDASSWRERANAIREAALEGEDAGYLAKGAEVFAARGLYEEAVIYQERAVELRRDALPEEGPEVATAEFALGCLLQLLGRDGQAQTHLERALSLRKTFFGAEDPATELVRESLLLLRGQAN